MWNHLTMRHRNRRSSRRCAHIGRGLPPHVMRGIALSAVLLSLLIGACGRRRGGGGGGFDGGGFDGGSVDGSRTDGGAPTPPPRSCTASTQCVDADPCTVGTCIARVCVVTVFDADGDTFPSIACGGTDCDDTNEAMHPGRPEACADGFDNDCDGAVESATCIGGIGADCETNRDCDAATGETCFPGGGPGVCTIQGCREPGFRSGGCAPGECFTGAERCMVRCAIAEDCRLPLGCYANTCQPVCSSAEDCRAGWSCPAGECIPP